jgi:hypothetical protein
MFYRQNDWLYKFRMLSLLGAVLCFCGAIGFTAWSIYITQNGTLTTGTIVDLVKQKDSSKGDFWQPVFKYQDAAHKVHTVQSSVGENPPGYVKGQQVPVIYMPYNPESASIATWSALWGTPLLFAAIGLFELFLSIGLAYLERHLKAPQQTPSPSLSP